MVVQHVDDDVVHHKCSRVCAGLHVLDVVLVLAETVDNKRFGTGSDLLNDIFEVTVCEYWHYGSENLLSH